MTVAGAAIAFRRPAPPAPALARRRDWRTPDFRALLGEAAWAELPAAVRARFDGASHSVPRDYPGAMQVRMTWLGWLFAQGCRLIGAPLAPWRAEAVAASVQVRPEPDGAIRWERTLAYPGRAPLVIASRKEASADGALREVTHGGLGMDLALSVEAGALVFRTTRYFFRLGALELPVPHALTPGRATIVHRDLGAGRFRFSLSFVHPLAGETFASAGDFHDPGSDLPDPHHPDHLP